MDEFEQVNVARKILGLPDVASFSQVKSAYRELARRFHPDREGGSETKAFREITLAYEVLERFWEHFPLPLHPDHIKGGLLKPAKRRHFFPSFFER